MRKFYLAIASCVALVAFMGFSANAFASHSVQDPDCSAVGNPQEMVDFSISTPDSSVANEVSNLVGSAYACGSSLETVWLIETCLGGDSTLNNHADIGLPPGFTVSDSDSVAQGSYAGSAKINVLYNAFGTACVFSPDVPVILSTDNKAGCENERAIEIVGAVPQGDIVACLRGTSPAGVGWQWNVTDADGKSWTTIGPMHTPQGIEPGLTYVNLDLCAYIGDTGAWDALGTCGTEENGDQFQQRNGDPSPAACNNGRDEDGNLVDTQGEGDPELVYDGLFTATVTNEAGETTTTDPPASSCVSWYRQPIGGGVVPRDLTCHHKIRYGGGDSCTAPQPPTKPGGLTESIPPR